jgi:hypothetical protein
VVADVVSVITFYGIPEVLADGASDENLDLGRCGFVLATSASGPRITSP